MGKAKTQTSVHLNAESWYIVRITQENARGKCLVGANVQCSLEEWSDFFQQSSGRDKTIPSSLHLVGGEGSTEHEMCPAPSSMPQRPQKPRGKKNGRQGQNNGIDQVGWSPQCH